MKDKNAFNFDDMINNRAGFEGCILHQHIICVLIMLRSQYVLLRSEILSGMCAKLRTVAASNNRDHARNRSYYCLLVLLI